MKYGESSFDILYLLFAIVSGCVLLRKAPGKTGKMMGIAALVLGCGDAFHLVPRVLNYFSDADLTAWLGIGKLITSVTMTVFYVLLYYIARGLYGIKPRRLFSACVWISATVRVELCCFPQNGWLENSSDMTWGIIRNVPFVILGALVCIVFFRNRAGNRHFRFFWLYILLSFLFYIPVAVFAGVLPILGMLMLPKTVCYILMIVSFLKSQLSPTKRVSGLTDESGIRA